MSYSNTQHNLMGLELGSEMVTAMAPEVLAPEAALEVQAPESSP